ncbi:hypothetical protein B0O99DRAFT_514090 [Bisporella sp. PMI_857]|nr:hypothetical protein B0O99DRAFT_514090 [Bisporella sp. PMI_857]
MHFKILMALSLLNMCHAQRPSNTTLCDYYTHRLLGSNTAENQHLLQSLFINTVVLGNYTTPNTGVAVAGFAAPNTYNNTKIELLPFFTGAYNSTNLGGEVGSSKLFLDDGGAVPLTMNKSSNGNIHSAQYQLLEHIYQYFGTLMGCSLQGSSSTFPSYQGRTSMYEVHRYMNLDRLQMDFFIEQCVLSLKSLGVSVSDADTFGQTLNSLFNFRCSPPTVVKGEGPNWTVPELQSVCVAESCPLSENGNCKVYPRDGVALQWVNITEIKNTTGNGTMVGGAVQASGIGAKGFDLLLTVFSVIGFALMM